MKKLFIYHVLSLFLLTGPVRLVAQSVAINTDGSVPHASAMLDVKSSDKGVLVPRMTAGQRNAIVNPSKGLLVFQTDPVPVFCYYNGYSWINLSNGNTIGSNGFSSNYGFTITYAGDTTSVAVPPVDGYGTTARFGALNSIAADTKGNLYVTESARHSIRRINAMGLVSTLAGSAFNQGYLDDSAGTARFKVPLAIAVDTLGNVYVADLGNNCIRKVTPTGIVSTYSGVQGLSGNVDGNSATARFRSPSGIASDKSGNLYVSDRDDAVVRKIDMNKNVTTIGGAASNPGLVNSADNLGYTLFRTPGGMVTDTTGNLYIADEGNHCIRRITPAGIVTTFAGTGATGNTDGTLTTATFKSPKAMAIDMDGNLYVVDASNHNIRKITPAGVVSTVAGSGSPGYLDGPDVAALFNIPSGIAVDAVGNLYVADNVNNTIRKIFLR